MRAFAVLAVFVAASLPYPDNAAAESFGERKGCAHTHASKLAYERVRVLVRHTRSAVRKGRVQHFATCVATRAKAHRAHVLARSHWRWRHQYAQRWTIRLNRLPSWDRAWAYRTSSCESGMDPSAHNPSGIYHGAFQFLLSTWYAAGGTGDPHQHSWHMQAVVAVRWMHRAGASQWPVCGV